jgi:putative endonuclease
LRVLARRLRTAGGEVDLVALDGETLVFVEVKASSTGEGPDARRPSDRVDHAKRRRLLGASRVLRRGPFADRPWRIDVAAVRFEGRRADVTLIRGAVAGSGAR